MGRTLVIADVLVTAASDSSAAAALGTAAAAAATAESTVSAASASAAEPVTLKLSIASVHLESLANAEYRRAQLSICANVLGGGSADTKMAKQGAQEGSFANGTALLMGDFNFDSMKNFGSRPGVGTLENDCIKQVWPGAVDLWPHFHVDHHDVNPDKIPGERWSFSWRWPEARGLTFDPFRNPVIATSSDYSRYDRILLHNSEGAPATLQPRSMEIVGQRIFEGAKTKVRVCISDHFGLFATFDAIAAATAARAAARRSSAAPVASGCITS
jgi:hypothetical protein